MLLQVIVLSYKHWKKILGKGYKYNNGNLH